MSRISNILNPFSNILDINERDIDTLVIKKTIQRIIVLFVVVSSPKKSTF
jgi:hypothetical protein